MAPDNVTNCHLQRFQFLYRFKGKDLVFHLYQVELADLEQVTMSFNFIICFHGNWTSCCLSQRLHQGLNVVMDINFSF